MEAKEPKKEDLVNSYDDRQKNLSLNEMNEAFMKNYESARQSKINKYFFGIVVFLLMIVGFQSFLLFQRNDLSDSQKSIIQFDEGDLISPDTSTQDWDPFKDFQRMQKRMDEFFENGFPEFDRTFPNMKSFSFGGSFSSQNFDLKDNGDKYTVTLEIPGLDRTNVNVNIEDQSLKISGNMERKNESKKSNSVFQSHQTQHFERYLTLPGPVLAETLRVDYDENKIIITIEKNVS